MATLGEKMKAFDDGSFDRLVKEIRNVAHDETEFQALLIKRITHRLVTRTVRKEIAAEEDVGRRLLWQFEFGLIPTKRRSSAMNRACDEKAKSHGQETGKKSVKEKVSKLPAEDLLEIPMNESDVGRINVAKKRKLKKLDNQERRETRKKKLKNSPNVPTPELPISVRTKIEQLGGTETMIVVQKQLFASDVLPDQGRLLIPTTLMNPKFLRPEEAKSLDQFYARKQGSKDFRALIIEPSLKASKVSLRRWAGKRGMTHFLVHGWTSIVVSNGLRAGQMVQLWSFRIDANLCFALVVLESGKRSESILISDK